MLELHTEVIDRLSDIGHVLVVGGVVRDLAFFGADERPIADIDFVVTGRVRSLDLLARKLNAIPNRFGGYGLERGGFRVDFWSLHNTWAKKELHAKVNTPRDLIKTTFFDWDAVVYDLSTSDIYAIPGYIDKLHRRVIDINLEPNPSIEGNLVRALRRIVMWDARPGPRLRRFLDANLHTVTWKRIVEAERGAFHVRYLDQFHSSMDFKLRGLAKRNHGRIGIDDRRQTKFDFYVEGREQIKP